MVDENELREKYLRKLKESLRNNTQINIHDNLLNSDLDNESFKVRSSDYLAFREAMLSKNLTRYEKLCKFFGKVLVIDIPKKNKEKLEEYIEIAHLNITPNDAVSFAVSFPIILAFFVMLISLAFSFIMKKPIDLFLMLSMLTISLALIVVLLRVPEYLARKMQTKASNQMIMGVFYIVSFMRHTPNLELAIEFAANHLPSPLSLDFRRILWNIETGKYSNINDSLTHYLDKWRKTNIEFIESFNLIQGSLLESSEERRVELLDKAISVLLEETYEKMLHYAHRLKTPISTLHMFGIVLPLLGLVILPLVVGFLEGVYWYHIAMFYDIVLPLIVFYLSKKFLSLRPPGTNEVDISFINKPKNTTYKILSYSLAVVLILVGLSPIILHYTFGDSIDFQITNSIKFLDYRINDNGKPVGPFGSISVMLSVFVPLGIALGIGLHKYFYYKQLMIIRQRVEELEKEYSSALFQLGNRLSDGYPIENALESVATVMKETAAGKLFATIAVNIKQLGLGVYDAIFDPKVGAINLFPSSIVESSLKILVQTIKKGPQTAAVAVTNIAKYIQEIHRINERLKDLLTDVTSSIRSQMRFIAPIIASIVVALTTMITMLIGKIKQRIVDLSTQGETQQLSSLLKIFSNNIPPFHFQIIVGIFLVEMVYIMSLLNTYIEKGEDKINENYWLGKNMISSLTLYSLLTIILILIFSMIASVISIST